MVDVDRKTNAHEEAREGLGEVFSIRRLQTDSLPTGCRASADEAERKRVGPLELHQPDFTLQSGQLTSGKYLPRGNAAPPDVFQPFRPGQMMSRRHLRLHPDRAEEHFGELLLTFYEV